jgi:signal transduction histidine kinase
MGQTEARAAYETARLRLARYRVESQQARKRGAAHAAQVSAEALAVERVGVWMFPGQNQVSPTHGSTRFDQLVCLSQFTRSTRSHTSDQCLPAGLMPAYVRALSERRIIAASDAHHEPLTRELPAGYLTRAERCSLLDAPIIREGAVVGVVHHEHLGENRIWTQRDIDFASSVADMMTAIFEQADRLELEAALQEQAERRQDSQRMEALGRIACAVAHDFNNVLNTVSMSLDTLAPGWQDATTLEQVSEMIRFGQRLTQQLLEFGRQEAEQAQSSSDAGATLRAMLPMLRTAAGRSITLALQIATSDTRIALQQSHFEQVVFNLCLNARDAIRGAGEIKILLREPTPLEMAPASLVLEVADTGVGMSEATRARIFEPFFTTKTSGVGLGLATVYGIVRRANGLTRVDSEPGRGTSVCVALPRAPDA